MARRKTRGLGLVAADHLTRADEAISNAREFADAAARAKATRNKSVCQQRAALLSLSREALGAARAHLASVGSSPHTESSIGIENRLEKAEDRVRKAEDAAQARCFIKGEG